MYFVIQIHLNNLSISCAENNPDPNALVLLKERNLRAEDELDFWEQRTYRKDV